MTQFTTSERDTFERMVFTLTGAQLLRKAPNANEFLTEEIMSGRVRLSQEDLFTAVKRTVAAILLDIRKNRDDDE